MNETTRRALLEINRRFYRRFAASFSASRERPWPGWDRLLRRLPEAEATPRILDVGCGNSRFASYLADRLPGLDYLGIDSSSELLRRARSRLDSSPACRPFAARWRQLELTDGGLRQGLGDARFDWVAVFGVLHHIPGRDQRRRLIEELAAHLAPGGLLTVAVWRFDQAPRLATKILPWADYNRRATVPIDLSDLEEGDHLLTWSGDLEVPRYCHLVDDDEVRAISAATELVESDRFMGHGPGDVQNLYLVLENRPLDGVLEFPPSTSRPAPTRER